MKDNKTKKIAICAMLTAVTALISLISIPMPSAVPISLQCFAVALCGYFAGSLMGTISVMTYIAIGLVGLPVFAGFRGGFAVLLGPTGGFIIGFIPLCLLCGGFGIPIRKKKYRHILKIAMGLIGLSLCHLCGIVFFYFIMNADITTAFLASSAPYLIKDIACIIAGYFVGEILKKAINTAK
ncbi:MAG: biotin transporter BioY [Ruminococcaceae bacterium]|nr:biotin transporter BioY [Oscillospiraceae bacterium]